ncbi:Type 1 glutamine amidotransferase-like domain-containing protein [Mycobacterium sp. WUMAC-067]|uniref:Type 1 glutamine amidotransferase-like domain-containing protein n=1 Tax=unclassified Mycobacterium TaxID=2642494 RepID=UPI001CD9BB31|nr:MULTISPECIES: Type 1 glutamine amidotransferase-like domain-containing protein [unclassified Mycobacterium]MCA2245514.1 Type 1 glutamine amidotransferase-like domain-containing protein [Mycobacterium sp. WUMAC-067]MCA2317105.1 Type 1 glutamine amidotransferase-like domain-containing protein [Mycobacterium sp. WUMAC-025]
MTAPQLNPLYLLADSQLLFWKGDGRLLLEAALDGLPRDKPLSAAYVGASNGDRPEFYEIFEAAVDAVGITDHCMIHSSFGPAHRAFLENTQLIVLAGGDVRLGWNTFEETGMKQTILDRYTKGAVLVGISAGAVQLGRYGIVESPGTELLDVFNLAPMVIDVHDERADWGRLSRTIQLLEGAATGLGTPSGGGVVVHPDSTVEPLRYPAHKFVYDGTRVVQSLLSPPLIA